MAIRTWSLGVAPSGGPIRVVGELDRGEIVAAIELEPVLDLLERWVDGGGDAPHDTVALLREHGRLSANDQDRRDG